MVNSDNTNSKITKLIKLATINNEKHLSKCKPSAFTIAIIMAYYLLRIHKMEFALVCVHGQL